MCGVIEDVWQWHNDDEYSKGWIYSHGFGKCAVFLKYEGKERREEKSG